MSDTTAASGPCMPEHAMSVSPHHRFNTSDLRWTCRTCGRVWVQRGDEFREAKDARPGFAFTDPFEGDLVTW